MLLVPECVSRPPRSRGDGAVRGVAGLEMHLLDSKSRTRMLKDELGIGLCNITKCCTEVCPEEIHITDNAIIPLKERVVDEFYDPLLMLVRKIRGAK
jgi:succinate dehydrogenase / fumarate reductase iron-sulfur subunit